MESVRAAVLEEGRAARLIERRIGHEDIEDAFDAVRSGRYVRQVIES